jgi:hypothetical protein
MTEDYDFESDEISLELDELTKELDFMIQSGEKEQELFDHAFAWFDIAFEFPEKLESFKENVLSLRKILPFLNDDATDRFARGTILVGLVSAYEGLVHDLFLVCCNSLPQVKNAVRNIARLNEKDKSYLGLANDSSAEKLASALKKKTLHDPAQVVRLSNILFNLPLPAPHEMEAKFYRSLLSARNIYVHDNGLLDGKEYKVPLEVLNFSFNYFQALVDSYAHHLLEQANRVADEANGVDHISIQV